MKRTLLIAVVAIMGLMACLPNVSTELSEPEARALIEREVLNICGGKSNTIIASLLKSVEAAEPLATRDNWILHAECGGFAGRTGDAGISVEDCVGSFRGSSEDGYM